VEADRRLVRLVLDDVAVVLLLVLQRRLAAAGLFLGREDDRVGPGPAEALHAAGVLRQRPRLGARGGGAPDLRLGPLVGLALRFRRRPGGEEGDVPAVGRPARRGAAVGPAGQLDLAAAGEAGAEEVADVLVLVLVRN